MGLCYYQKKIIKLESTVDKIYAFKGVGGTYSLFFGPKLYFGLVFKSRKQRLWAFWRFPRNGKSLVFSNF